MEITHKILVSKETGKIVSPIYESSNTRPEPPDAVWVPVEPGSVIYKMYVSNDYFGKANPAETFWDFDDQHWVEVDAPSPTLEMVKHSRNERLRLSDRIIGSVTDPAELAEWIAYRQELRDMFDNIPEDFNWEQISMPRTPHDIARLRELAAEGDTDAQDIIQKDGL